MLLAQALHGEEVPIRQTESSGRAAGASRAGPTGGVRECRLAGVGGAGGVGSSKSIFPGQGHLDFIQEELDFTV